MTRLARLCPVLLTALLTACQGQVSIDPSESADAAEPPLTSSTAPSTSTIPTVITIDGDEPAHVEPCEGNAMCWPGGYCAADGYCAPQWAGACLVGGELTVCGFGEVCCDYGEQRDCAQPIDCPDGGA